MNAIDSNGRTTQSPWGIHSEQAGDAPLARDAACDVCVVGAGIAGLSVAYELACDGRRVIVIDRAEIGSGQTGLTTAHLSNAVDDRYFVIRRLHGAEGARICAASHTAAINRIEQIVRTEEIDCDFERVDGYLFLPPGGSAELLDMEWQAVREAGVDCTRLPRAAWPNFDTGPCLRFADQAQLHPLRYLAGLARAIRRMGGRIHPHTKLETLRSDGACREVVTGSQAVIRANSVVVATNTPVTNLVAIHTRQAAQRTYAIAARIPRGAMPHALYWDMLEHAGDAATDSYHYVRVAPWRSDWEIAAKAGAPRDDASQPDELLIVGGEDHKTGQAGDEASRWDRLERWIRERVPGLGEVVRHWSGQVWEPIDRVAFIGPNPGGPRHVYVVTGDSGMGMTHGAIAGMLLADWIAERPNGWAGLYDPSRISVRSGLNYVQENLNVAAQYLDWLSPGAVSNEYAIPPGTGAVVRRGLHLYAAYRDEAGEMHECSAVCPHLGGIVAWNAAEQSWDCPCHGSRFDPYGAVLNGPAVRPLEQATAPAHAPHA